MWFRAEFVAAILAGAKTDTIRRATSRVPKVGAIVGASVGPRKPFARLLILAVEPVIEEPSNERVAQLGRCGIATTEALVLVRFALLSAAAIATSPSPSTSATDCDEILNT